MDNDWVELRPILPDIPIGNPGIVRLTWAKQIDIKGLRDALPKFRNMCNEYQYEWWQKFIEKLANNQEKWKNFSDQFLKEAVTPDKWLLNKFKTYNEMPKFTQMTDEDERKRSAILGVIAKKNEMPRTTIGESKVEKAEREAREKKDKEAREAQRVKDKEKKQLKRKNDREDKELKRKKDKEDRELKRLVQRTEKESKRKK